MRPINILPLGVSGAGKTAYLASLYERLALQRSDTCFSLQTTPDRSQELVRLYQSIKNPNRAWPPGTMGAQYRDFCFDCVVGTKSGDYTVMQLNYLDFPGGLLTGETEQNERFFERFSKTDAYLILIDGVKVLRALSDDEEAIDSLNNDLTAILNPIGRDIRKPLHFVVTKWDVLEGAWDLGQVATLLNGFESFAQVVNMRRMLGRTTRLIPVSAVGSGFAKLSDDGTMTKSLNAKSRPYNVDLPISCLLFDLVSDMKRTIEEERSNLSFLIRLWYKMLGSRSLFLSVGKTIIDFLPVPPGTNFVRTMLQHGLSEISDMLARPQAQSRGEMGRKIVDADSQLTAFTAVIEYHALEMHWLKRQYPASLLSDATVG